MCSHMGHLHTQADGHLPRFIKTLATLKSCRAKVRIMLPNNFHGRKAVATFRAARWKEKHREVLETSSIDFKTSENLVGYCSKLGHVLEPLEKAKFFGIGKCPKMMALSIAEKLWPH